MIYWITGRAGAGKTTLANKMAKEFKEEGKCVLILDGDDVRKHFPNTGFTDEDRFNHIIKVARFAAIVEKQNIIVIIALVSPRKEWRQEARKLFQESQLIYIEGGTLWKGTTYEEPDEEEKPTRMKGRKEQC